jgi:hypothetical protein
LSVKVEVPVPAELIARSVTVVWPAVVGVPEMSPVLVFTVNPEGNPVTLYEVGLFVAEI